MATPYPVPTRRSWLIEAHVDEDGQLDLHMFPVEASGSLGSVPAVSVALAGFEDGEDEA